MQQIVAAGINVVIDCCDDFDDGELLASNPQIAYLHGFHDALRVGSILCLAGAVVAVLAIRKVEHRPAVADAPAVEAA